MVELSRSSPVTMASELKEVEKQLSTLKEKVEDLSTQQKQWSIKIERTNRERVDSQSESRHQECL